MDHTLVGRRALTKVLWILIVTGFLMAADVGFDLASGSTPAHAGLEALLAVLAVVGAVIIYQELSAVHRSAEETRSEVQHLTRDLARVEREACHWQHEAQELMRGLSHAIDDQFEAWSLTKAEKEVGLLLLKGLSFKEVATLRKTSAQTVRQQANQLYHKAGLSGRAELSAFFLEDLLLPSQRLQEANGLVGSRPTSTHREVLNVS